jgi:glutamine amidotransferase
MHNGQIGGYEVLRWQLDRLIPEHLYGERLGATDSELIFLLMIANGLEENPELAISTTLTQIIALMKEKNIADPFRFTSIVSDGQQMIAIRFSTDALAPSLYFKEFDDHIVIGSEPLDFSHKEWNLIPAGHTVKIKGNSCDIVPLPETLTAQV